MILIIGGAYQGKTAYAKQTYGLQDADIFTCEGLALDPAARCVRHLERFALACVQAGKEPADELRTLDLSDKILLCEDISCGVVPIDPEQRAWREAVGRMNAMLAARAEGKPLVQYTYHGAALACHHIAGRLCGRRVPLMKITNR